MSVGSAKRVASPFFRIIPALVPVAMLAPTPPRARREVCRDLHVASAQDSIMRSAEGCSERGAATEVRRYARIVR